MEQTGTFFLVVGANAHIGPSINGKRLLQSWVDVGVDPYNFLGGFGPYPLICAV